VSVDIQLQVFSHQSEAERWKGRHAAAANDDQWPAGNCSTSILSLHVSCVYISQGSVATPLWRDEIFDNNLIANFSHSVPVKEFVKYDANLTN